METDSLYLESNGTQKSYSYKPVIVRHIEVEHPDIDQFNKIRGIIKKVNILAGNQIIKGHVPEKFRSIISEAVSNPAATGVDDQL